MMKKLLACLLAALMLWSACAALAEQPAAATEGMVTIFAADPVEDLVGVQEGTQLVVGSVTEMKGDFGSDQFGSNASDLDVRSLLHGYSTVAWTRTLGMTLDGVAVSRVEATVADNGDRTYTLQIASNLTYNDGTPITAKDYVFSLLLSGAPELLEIGATRKTEREKITGFSAYTSGASKVVSGVRLLSDTSFSITITAEYLPYFYGLEMLNITPYPISVIAPGCDVLDNGEGVYLGAAANAGSISAQGYTPGVFSADMLRVTMLDPATGYLNNPRVTSGPYALESYDKNTHVATFTINRNYVGNYESQKPHIERIVFKCVKNETMIDELRNGDVDLLNRVSSVESINSGLVMADQAGLTQRVNYPRTGFAFLAFACESDGPSGSVAVRQAVARCVDKTALVASFVGGTNGIPVHGYYGLGQWMINQSFPADADNRLDELTVLVELENLATTRDLAAAEQLLEDDGWNLNKDGEPYAKGTDTLRYRDNDGALEPLTIRWAWPTENKAGAILDTALSEAFAEIGIGMEATEMPFEELLQYYYRQNERTYDMFFLATNFDYIFDPYLDFNTADEYQGATNKTGLKDEELMELAKSMRSTPSMEMRTYVERWLAFQKRFAQLMPMVPLYSNVYFDFYPNDLQGYNIAEYASWALAIPYAYIADAPVEPELTIVDFGPTPTPVP